MRLLVDGVDVASCEVASSPMQKTKGLLGRTSLDGALFFPDVSWVHTFFMRFTIDVAFLHGDLVVEHVCTMKPWQVSRRIGKHVLEAQAGAFERWNIRHGSKLTIT